MLPGQALLAQGDPFQESSNNLPGQPGEYANPSIAVPTNRTLVAISASVRVRVPPGQAVRASLYANGPPGVVVGTLHFALSLQGTFAGFDVFTAASSTLLWMSSGGFAIERNSNVGLMAVETAISGFLLP
jgi:hypothetical protein